MSIKTTKTITRRFAIERIEKIYDLILDKNYMLLEDSSWECDYNIRDFVNSFVPFIETEKIIFFTNNMLEDYMDMPYFRLSMFENYNVIDEN